MLAWPRQVGDVLHALSPMRPILFEYRWGILALLGTGVLASLAEGIGISLFIPFLQSLAEHATSGDTWLEAQFYAIFGDMPRQQRLTVISLCIVSTLILKSVLGYVHDLLYAWTDTHIGHRLRFTVFRRLLDVEYGFIERGEHGDLLNTLTAETWRTVDAVRTVLWMVITLCGTALYLAILLLISWQWTLVVGAAMLFIAGMVRLLNGRVRALGEEATVANAALTTRMIEGLAAMKVIRAFQRETYEQDRFDAASSRVRRVFFRLGAVSGAVSPLYEVLTALLLGAVLLVGMRDVANVPLILVFIFVLYRLQPKVRALDSGRLSLVSLLPAVYRVRELLTLDVSPPARSSIARPSLLEDIRLQHVSFSYDPAWNPVLHDVTVTIPAGKTTAIVGISGAGKTTLLNLLLRFYEPTRGTILVDGAPLSSISLEAWRERIALVSQDIYLFNATVYDNIAYGRANATFDEVVEAAKRAHAHTFIMDLPEQYATHLGERGTRLSGGQQQRITLARAIVRNPSLLILDEATNALDAVSEHVVQEALDLLRRDRTILVVAHRFSTIKQADHVIVLEEGRVCEQAPPEVLLSAGGRFAEMSRLQQQPLVS
jgi:subfamily B ATP-binding cassette protein MsbA